jgi:hypothetical protein
VKVWVTVTGPEAVTEAGTESANQRKSDFVDLEAFDGDLPCVGRKQAVVLQ